MPSPLNADLFEILPEQPYTAADLDYNSDCRTNTEQQDETARPAILPAAASWKTGRLTM
ncbi:flavodoxin [Agathobaculum massiliense]|uniref:flavodoxin n=1 Tax=Agathobaculum massiliense TaxID=3014267 RepID=UPI0024143DD1|nr:flavodoxin [Agathobaculum massiliense]MBS6882700.1 hypothetical protein [Clostridiaceae bacterium]